MDIIEELKQEHDDIERELLELEMISNSEKINYSNLAHTFRKLHSLWDKHEEKEEKLFPELKREKIVVPAKKMQFEHKELRVHKDAMNKAINSGSEIEMRNALMSHGKAIIEKLRKHINDEDEILYTLTAEEFSTEELERIMDVKF